MLYPLSYTVNVTGFEPATSELLVLRSTTELHAGAANLHRQNPFTEQAIRMSCDRDARRRPGRLIAIV